MSGDFLSNKALTLSFSCLLWDRQYFVCHKPQEPRTLRAQFIQRGMGLGEMSIFWLGHSTLQTTIICTFKVYAINTNISINRTSVLLPEIAKETENMIGYMENEHDQH